MMIVPSTAEPPVFMYFCEASEDGPTMRNRPKACEQSRKPPRLTASRLVPFVEVDVHQRGGVDRGGVVHEHVAAAEFALHGGRSARDAGVAGDVAADRDRAGAACGDVGGDLGGALFVTIQQRHASADGGEFARDLRADAAGRAGDDADLVVEFEPGGRSGSVGHGVVLVAITVGGTTTTVCPLAGDRHRFLHGLQFPP